MVKVKVNSTLRLWLAIVGLGLVIWTAFGSLPFQASATGSNVLSSTNTHTKTIYRSTTVFPGGTKTVTSTKTVTTTVMTLSSCHSITGPAGRVYCGPLFDLLNYRIFAHDNRASVTMLILNSPTEIDSAQFFDQGVTYNLSCRPSVADQGQVVTCSSSGFSPPISTTAYDYAMSVSAHNPGDTELFLTQSWSASFLMVTP
jgi:hypothetical protein